MVGIYEEKREKGEGGEFYLAPLPFPRDIKLYH
jgi:hypothetical protein